MGIRTDITVEWERSPRIITVAAPSVNLSMADLFDTARSLEHLVDPGYDVFSYPSLLSAAGNEQLEPGKNVGITITLQNAQVAFEKRDTPVSIGFATTANAAGEILIDNNATFQTDGVEQGAMIINFDDLSIGEVVSIDSEQQIKHRTLVGGSNAWDVNDDYKIFNIVACTLSGGNIVAVDANGDPLAPVQSTPFVYINRTLSSEPVAIETSGGDGDCQKVINLMLAGF